MVPLPFAFLVLLFACTSLSSEMIKRPVSPLFYRCLSLFSHAAKPSGDSLPLRRRRAFPPDLIATAFAVWYDAVRQRSYEHGDNPYWGGGNGV